MLIAWRWQTPRTGQFQTGAGRQALLCIREHFVAMQLRLEMRCLQQSIGSALSDGLVQIVRERGRLVLCWISNEAGLFVVTRHNLHTSLSRGVIWDQA